MVFNGLTKERVSVLNEHTSGKARERFARHHVRDELPSNVGASVGRNPKISSRQNTSRKSSSPLSGSRSSFLLSPSEHDQSQLHRRNNRPRTTGSQRGKENVPPLCQLGRTYTAKARRPVLADVTNVNRGGSEPLDDVPFAGSTSIKSPSQKVGNAEPGSAGLRFELNHSPILANSDSQKTITQDSFVPVVIKAVDFSTEFRPESTHASPSTPLREVLAAFNVMFSSTSTPPANSSTTTNDPPNTSRLSFRLPAPPLSAGVSISNAFNLSTLAGSISQLTGDIATSIAAHYENDCLYQGQYHEDAVVRDERFHWEEEMRYLEVQCGLYGETK